MIILSSIINQIGLIDIQGIYHFYKQHSELLKIILN